MPKHVQTQRIPVTLAERPHPFPSRTRKLSSPAPKILRGQPFGKIGRRRDFCVSGEWSESGYRARRSGGLACRPVSCPHDPGRGSEPAPGSTVPPSTTRHLSLPPRRERLAQCLAGEGASLPGGGQRRTAFRREAEAVVPDRRPQDMSRVCDRARPREIRSVRGANRGRLPDGPIRGWPRSCSTTAGSASPCRPLPAIGRQVSSRSVRSWSIAFAAIAFARLSGVGDGGLVAGAGSPSPQATLAAALPTPTPSPVSTPVPSAAASPVLTPAPSPTQPARTYKVKRGETLSGIAARFGTTVRVLIDLNDIKNPSRIPVGARARAAARDPVAP